MTTTTRICQITLAAAALFAATASFGATTSKADYTATKDRIEADYKADRAACGDTRAAVFPEPAITFCLERGDQKQ